MSSHQVPEMGDRLIELLSSAERILVFTGAGISTASGIPDYRGPQGVWKTRTPVYYHEFMTSSERRRAYWQQKMEDSETWGAAAPNEVHRAVVRLEEAGKLEAVVTQNIDGLHAAAGTSRERLIEIHGTNREVECQSCRKRSEPEPHFEAFRRTGAPPVCECGGFLKPATISFGQDLRVDDLARAQRAADRCDLVLSLGSTLAVNPAASIPLYATQRGTPYVIINAGPTEHDRRSVVTLRLEGDVIEIVPPAVDAALRNSSR
jgi:NAD-dependent deacetylase